MRVFVPQNDLRHLEMPPTALKKLDSERVAAMAMGGAVLAACVATLGEGLGLIERDNSPSICAARNGLERVHAAFFHREMASRWQSPCLEST